MLRAYAVHLIFYTTHPLIHTVWGTLFGGPSPQVVFLEKSLYMKNLGLFIALLFPLALFAQTGELVVKIENIKRSKGSMKIAVYNKEELFLSDEVVTLGSQKVEGDTLVFVFSELPYGAYAMSIFHDENDNGKLDSNFMGIPSEPYGFSNNARGTFGPPKFEDCLVKVQGSTIITIEL